MFLLTGTGWANGVQIRDCHLIGTCCYNWERRQVGGGGSEDQNTGKREGQQTTREKPIVRDTCCIHDHHQRQANEAVAASPFLTLPPPPFYSGSKQGSLQRVLASSRTCPGWRVLVLFWWPSRLPFPSLPASRAPSITHSLAIRCCTTHPPYPSNVPLACRVWGRAKCSKVRKFPAQIVGFFSFSPHPSFHHHHRSATAIPSSSQS